METLIINVPEKKSALVKKLLKELGVTIEPKKSKKLHVPNALTAKAIDDARKGVGLNGPITDVTDFMKSI